MGVCWLCDDLVKGNLGQLGLNEAEVEAFLYFCELTRLVFFEVLVPFIQGFLNAFCVVHQCFDGFWVVNGPMR